MKEPEPLVPKYGGYRKLKSYRTAQLVQDFTELFCEQYVDEESRTYDRMMQAAHSAAQKIAEGSVAGEKSKKSELKLTNLGRASLEELRRDYEGFLQQQGLPLWDVEDPRHAALTAGRPVKMDDVMQWIDWVHAESGTPPTAPGEDADAETVANGALILIALAFAHLDRQLSAQERAVAHELRLAERLRRRRLADWPE